VPDSGRERREGGCHRRHYRRVLSGWSLCRRLWREELYCLCVVKQSAMGCDWQGTGIGRNEPFRERSGMGDASRLKLEDESPLLG
jgi:hypothetical protein